MLQFTQHRARGASLGGRPCFVPEVPRSLAGGRADLPASSRLDDSADPLPRKESE